MKTTSHAIAKGIHRISTCIPDDVPHNWEACALFEGDCAHALERLAAAYAEQLTAAQQATV